jgi:hypothetical protein
MSLLPTLFIVGSHCWQQGVNFINFEGLSLHPAYKETLKQKINGAYRAPITRKFFKESKDKLPKAEFLNLRCHWLQGVNLSIHQIWLFAKIRNRFSACLLGPGLVISWKNESKKSRLDWSCSLIYISSDCINMWFIVFQYRNGNRWGNRLITSYILVIT